VTKIHYCKKNIAVTHNSMAERASCSKDLRVALFLPLACRFLNGYVGTEKYCTIDPEVAMEDNKLLERIVVNPKIFGGKPIIRGRRLAVEHILGMLAAGDTPETILQGYPFLEPEDIRACLVYANRLVSHERVELLVSGTAA
jgi:uncharacterized protein (DUF433 family)